MLKSVTCIRKSLKIVIKTVFFVFFLFCFFRKNPKMLVAHYKCDDVDILQTAGMVVNAIKIEIFLPSLISCSAPRLWNALPQTVKTSGSLSTFKQSLKATFLPL